MLSFLPLELITIIFNLLHKHKLNFALISKNYYMTYILKALKITNNSTISDYDVIQQMRNKKLNIKINIKYLITSLPKYLHKLILINDVNMNLSKILNTQNNLYIFEYNREITNSIVIMDDSDVDFGILPININSKIIFSNTNNKNEFLNSEEYEAEYSRIHIEFKFGWGRLNGYKIMLLIDDCICFH